MGWFNDPDTKKLSNLIEEALGISMNIIEKCSPYLGKRFLGLMGNVPSTIHYTGIKNDTLFAERWDKDKALGDMTALIEKGKTTSILPKHYVAQLLCYAKENGKISANIKSHLKMMPLIMECTNESLKKRIGVLNNQAELASRLKHSDFPAFFDFGYRNSKGINNTLLRITDKLRF